MLRPSEPQLKEINEIVNLTATDRPMLRLYLDWHFHNSTALVVTAENVDTQGRTASFKFQESDVHPIMDWQGLAGIPMHDPAKPDTSPDVSVVTHVFGGFTASCTDIVPSIVVNLPAGGVKVFEWSTKKHFLQMICTNPTSAKLRLRIVSTRTIVPAEGKPGAPDPAFAVAPPT